MIQSLSKRMYTDNPHLQSYSYIIIKFSDEPSKKKLSVTSREWLDCPAGSGRV